MLHGQKEAKKCEDMAKAAFSGNSSGFKFTNNKNRQKKLSKKI